MTTSNIQYDRSLLREAQHEFAVVSDLHFMNVPKDARVEFQSRLKQSLRAESALAMVAALGVPLVIHLGDLVQEIPGTDAYDVSRAKALASLRKLQAEVRMVAGNHDVGDKPDPTLVGLDICPEWLAAYEAEQGRSWYSFEVGGWRVVVLNAQLLNSGLVQEEAQWAWLEKELGRCDGKRTIVCLHMSLYLADPGEPGLGNYDNISEPARGRLLALLASHRVAWVLSGHVHFSFYDRIGPTRFLTFTSPAFTRPGFPHVFTAGAPPERGRDDTSKLGFYLFRIVDDEVECHFIRTSGRTDLTLGQPANGVAEAEGVAPQRVVLTRTTRSLPDSPLGVSLRAPLASATQVPLAWPSVVRQPVRNDYPLLACLEMGVRHVRVPATDLADPFQSRRLEILRGEGVRVRATSIWCDHRDLADRIGKYKESVDEWELQVPGERPGGDALRSVAACSRTFDVPFALAPIVPGAKVAGKQHPRTRRTYTPDSLESVAGLLQEANIEGVRLVCALERVGDGANGWRSLLSQRGRKSISGVDFCLELPGDSERINANRVLRGLLTMHLTPFAGSRLYVEPLVDMDRTMDTGGGLLDTLCNPRVPFGALKQLNSILAGDSALQASLRALDFGKASPLAYSVSGERVVASLILPPDGGAEEDVGKVAAAVCPGILDARSAVVYELERGVCRRQSVGDVKERLRSVKLSESALIVAEE